MIASQSNGDGTRTDVWKQELPHATYLTMIAVGDFAVVRDQWRDLEVNYYVEPGFEQYASLIFGNTPEMMEFRSEEHTSELQSLMRISYDVFCLTKKKYDKQ